MRALCSELRIELFESHRRGDHVYISPEGIAKRYAGDLPLPSQTAAAVKRALNKLEEVVCEVDAAAPWLHLRAEALDSQSLEEWLSCNVSDPVAADVVRCEILSTALTRPLSLTRCAGLLADCFMTKPSSSFSVLSALGTVAAGAGSLNALLDTSQCLHYRVVGGSQVVAQEMAQALGPHIVRLASPVTRIAWSSLESQCDATNECASAASRHSADVQQSAASAVTVITSRGCVRARGVVVAVPPNLVRRIAFQPPLPIWRAKLHDALTQGHVIKVLAVYPTPFWRLMGLSGEGFAPHSCSAIKEIYDNTPPSGQPGVICSFLVGDAAVRAAALPGGVGASHFRDMVLLNLAAFLGACAHNADAVLACDWSAEEWTGGGYCGTFGLGGVLQHCRNRNCNVGPLVFAATELAGVGHMHMEGAVRSGAAAAAAVAAHVVPLCKL
jgi:putrescine oxidase